MYFSFRFLFCQTYSLTRNTLFPNCSRTILLRCRLTMAIKTNSGMKINESLEILVHCGDTFSDLDRRFRPHFSHHFHSFCFCLYSQAICRCQVRVNVAKAKFSYLKIWKSTKTYKIFQLHLFGYFVTFRRLSIGNACSEWRLSQTYTSHGHQ